MVYVIGDTPALTWLGADAPEHGLIRAATVRKRSLISSVSKTAPSRSPQKQGESPAEVDERRVLRLARRVAADAALVFVHIGSNEAANVAVTDLRATTGVAGPEIPLRLLVDVGNFSDTARRGLMLQVGIDSKGLRQMPVDAIDPWQSRTLSLSLPLGSPGPHVVHAAVSPGPSLARSQVRDALPIDDTRLLAIDVLEDVPVLLVDGKPGLTPLDGSAGYLSTALAPRTDTGSEGTFSPTIVSDRELAFEPLGDYGVVALCNVPQLDTGEWQRLEGFVADGGGLLLFGGDAIDTANYNTQGYRGGAGLLPCRLSGPIGDLQSHDRFVRLEPGSFTHPVLRDFSDHPESGLFRARVQAFLAVEKVLPDTEVPLRYTDSHAAMILRRFGRGSVALFTTSADMSWTNLPAKGDYVSLIVNLVSYLTPSSSQGRTLLVGETISEPLAPDEASLPLRVTLPDGEVIRAAPVRKRLAAVPSTGGPSLPLRFLSGGVEDRGSFLSLPVEQVGAYELSIGPKAVTWVANIDAGESALRGAGERELRKALHCPFTYVAAPDLMRATITRRTSHEFATRLLYAVFALLVLESWLAGKFGAYR